MAASCLLIVEDQAGLARALARTFEPHFDQVLTAGDVASAIETYGRHRRRVDVIVADIDLPDGDGLDLVRQLRETDPALGAVVASGCEPATVADRAVALGVQGYLRKPFETSEIRVNVENARRWRVLELENRSHRDRLERLVDARTVELRLSRWETIHRLSMAAERHDEETGNHLERMSAYSAVLARRAGLGPERCEDIRLAAPMHDIGKIAIPDAVLLCEGPFGTRERAIMRRHTTIGHDLLAGSPSTLLQTGATIARSHHEWWDGSGYPDGLAGEQIPIEGRIVAIADVFDTLLTARRYKPAFSVEETVAVMRAERGTHFDPELLDAFLADLDELLMVRDAFSDEVVAA